MLKLPAVIVRATAERKFDAWMGWYGLSNATAIAKQLQKLFWEEKKRRKKLEKK